MIEWKAALAMTLVGALALGCSEDLASNGGGSGGSGGQPACAEECNDAACPAEIPPYPSFACEQAGLGCSYTFGDCVIDFACGGEDPTSAQWKATAPSGCEIPVACSLDGAPEGAACATKAEHCDIACSECWLECGDDNRWHEKCPTAPGDCG